MVDNSSEPSDSSDFGVGIGDLIKQAGTGVQTLSDLGPRVSRTLDHIDALLPEIRETTQTADMALKVVAGTVAVCGFAYILKSIRG